MVSLFGSCLNNLNVNGNKAVSPASDLSPFSSTPSNSKTPKIISLSKMVRLVPI